MEHWHSQPTAEQQAKGEGSIEGPYLPDVLEQAAAEEGPCPDGAAVKAGEGIAKLSAQNAANCSEWAVRFYLLEWCPGHSCRGSARRWGEEGGRQQVRAALFVCYWCWCGWLVGWVAGYMHARKGPQCTTHAPTVRVHTRTHPRARAQKCVSSTAAAPFFRG